MKNRTSYHTRRFILLAVLLVACALPSGSTFATYQGRDSGAVLSYATNTSRSGLLDATNAARISNGLTALANNDQLNSSAQAKAEHISVNDYWAHTAPDGTGPWYFFDRSGYAYIKAGENLAYGFASSQDTINGWLNSPSHKANMLGDYRDVGFGIVNSPNYQSKGEQTIVVAHYGSTKTPAPIAAPVAPATPTPSAPSRSSVPAQPETASPQTPVAEPTTTQLNPTSQYQPAPVKSEDPKDATPEQTQTVSSPPEEKVFTGLGRLAAGTVPAAVLVSLTLVFVAASGYITLHRKQFTHAAISGEKFVMTHPAFDAAIISVVAFIVLTASYGAVR